jgi:hypothetical protein
MPKLSLSAAIIVKNHLRLFKEICHTVDYWSLKLLLENICR